MLENKRIIVTGAARGMGEATVIAYVSAGAQVVAMDINDENGAAVVAEANKAGPGQATYQHIDIADKDSVFAAFDQAANHLGGLDALAHPAAIQAGADPVESASTTGIKCSL